MTFKVYDDFTLHVYLFTKMQATQLKRQTIILEVFRMTHQKKTGG